MATEVPLLPLLVFVYGEVRHPLCSEVRGLYLLVVVMLIMLLPILISFSVKKMVWYLFVAIVVLLSFSSFFF